MCGRLDVDQDHISDWTKEWVGATWGIQPTWAKKLLINAQGETGAETKTFRNAFAESRCLAPCSDWYEGRDEGGPRKQKYHFTAADGNPLLMGRILFPGEEGPEMITLTINPNQECAK